MDKWEPLVDRLIREGMERGEFDDLAGSGKPIDLSENPFEDPDVRTANRLLRNAGFAPAWIEERKDIDAELHRAKTVLSRAHSLYQGDSKLAMSPPWQRAVKEFRETVDQLNERIRLYNLKAPVATLHRRIISADDFVSDLERKTEQG
jgi:DnaJ family protein C protein 28